MSDETQRPAQERLIAIRLNWLRWLCTPLRLLWFVIVETARAGWRLLTLAAGGVRYSYDLEMLLRAGIGGSIFFAFLLLFAYIAVLAGKPVLILAGLLICLFPLAWTWGEATSVALIRSDARRHPVRHDIPKGNGFSMVGSIAIYIGIILLATAIQWLLSLLIALPGIGQVLPGILFIPNILLALLIVFTAILLAFSLPAQPSFLLMGGRHKGGNRIQQYVHTNLRLLGALRNRSFWLQLLLITPAAVIAAAIAAIPMVLLIMTAGGIAASLMGAAALLFDGAQQSLLAFGGLESLLFGVGVGQMPASFYIGAFLLIPAAAVCLGFAFAPFMGALASTYHSLYRRRSEGKTWTLLLLVIIVILVGGTIAVVTGPGSF